MHGPLFDVHCSDDNHVPSPFFCWSLGLMPPQSLFQTQMYIAPSLHYFKGDNENKTDCARYVLVFLGGTLSFNTLIYFHGVL